MAYEQPDNSFSAFRIPDHERRNNGPLFAGKLKIGDQLYFVDIWENEVRSGDNAGSMYLGGKVKPMQSRGGGGSRGESSRGDSNRGGSSRDNGGSRGDDRNESRRYSDDRGRPGGGGDDRGRGGDSRSGGSRSGGGRMNEIIDDDIPF